MCTRSAQLSRLIVALVTALSIMAACATSPASPTASTAAPPPSGPLPTASPAGPTASAALPNASTGVPTVFPTATATASATPDPTGTPRPTARATPTSNPTPRPTPRPTATARPTARPSATPRPPAASVLVRHGSRARNDIALTFDMGGRVGDALAIVGWLVEHRIHASIFVTGAMADSRNTDAGRTVLGIIDDHPELFTLGNHSYTHRDFRDLTAAQIRDELRLTETALAKYCGQDPRPIFRPPNGGYASDVLAAVGAAGYGYTVTWDVDTIDWRPIKNDPPGPTADQIVTKVLANAQNGSIVLMHLGGYETFAALPRVVAGLTGKGFDLVTLDEMLGT